MSIYGYCRIFTAKQSIDRQIRNIKAEYPTAHIVQEAYTGTSIFRPERLKLYRALKAGDTVVFDKEVADLHQRTREELVTAKLNGKQIGRKKVLDLKPKSPKRPRRRSVSIVRRLAAHWMTWSA